MTISTVQPGTATPRPDDPKKLKEAASQFEGFMLSEMLKSAWAGSAGDETESSVAAMAQEQFAQALASSGGLGLANLVLKQLSPVP